MDKEYFKLLQELAGLTNGETADLLAVSEVTIEKWRSGQRTVSPMRVQELLVAVREEIKEKVRAFNVVDRKYR
jgi:DNA-binding transcriptional regulator YdaS (Cro superfamily)